MAQDAATGRGWPAWALTWLSILIATVATALLMARLSSEGARVAVESALADQLIAQAGQVDVVLSELPVELLVAMGGDRSEGELRQRVDGLARGGRLRAVALLGPNGIVIGNQGQWLPAAAEADLLVEAAAGQAVAGPLYRGDSGALYKTAYHPLTGHPGYVVAVEGKAATLGAVDALERTQMLAAVASTVLAGLLGAVLAALVSGPLRRLGRELAAVQPGAPPSALGSYGVREVRQVSAAGQKLLAAIVDRDAEIEAGHQHELDQLTRMAAEIAHEVGNPLNAISLSVERLATLQDPTRRGRVVTRVRQQLGELAVIVERLRNLTRPLCPQPADLLLAPLIRGLVAEQPELELVLVIDPSLGAQDVDAISAHTDAGLLTEILRNLCRNAHQAGAKRLEVVVGVHGPTLWLLISDDGGGIPEDQVAHVFSWFHTTRATGTGLGLPHARRVAVALGGSLELQTARPATFRLSLTRRLPLPLPLPPPLPLPLPLPLPPPQQPSLPEPQS